MIPHDVKAARKTMGLSINGFADILGVSGRTVRRWEDGTRDPSELTLRFISSILAQHKDSNHG